MSLSAPAEGFESVRPRLTESPDAELSGPPCLSPENLRSRFLSSCAPAASGDSVAADSKPPAGTDDSSFCITYSGHGRRLQGPAGTERAAQQLADGRI